MSTEEATPSVLDRLPVIPSKWFARILGIAVGLVLWFWLASVFPNQLMPYPLEVFEITWGLVVSGTATEHLSITLLRTFLGFLGSMLFALVFGVMMGTTDYWERFNLPFVLVGVSIPAVAWAAITTVIFGFQLSATVVATVLTVTPFITIYIWRAVSQIDADLVEMATAFEVSRWRVLSRIILRSIAPTIFAMFRFSLAISWKIVLISETFASSSGIGNRLIAAYQRYRFEEAWAWALVFMVIILLIEYVLFKPLERRAFRYRREADFDKVGRR